MEAAAAPQCKRPVKMPPSSSCMPAAPTIVASTEGKTPVCTAKAAPPGGLPPHLMAPTEPHDILVRPPLPTLRNDSDEEDVVLGFPMNDPRACRPRSDPAIGHASFAHPSTWQAPHVNAHWPNCVHSGARPQTQYTRRQAIITVHPDRNPIHIDRYLALTQQVRQAVIERSWKLSIKPDDIYWRKLRGTRDTMYVALLIEAPHIPEFICPHVTLSYGVHIHDYVTLWSVKSRLSGYLTPRTLSGTWFVEHGRTGFKI